MSFDLESTMDVLRRTPGDAPGAARRQSPEPWARGNEGADTFSPFDVVGHLIDGEETDWIPRARIILARGPDPRFEPYDRFRHRSRNVGRSLESLLTSSPSCAPRTSSCSAPGAWVTPSSTSRATTRASAAVTLRHLLASWVVHDLGHIAQVVPGDGQAVSRRGRALGAVPAGAHRPRAAALLAHRTRAISSRRGVRDAAGDRVSAASSSRRGTPSASATGTASTSACRSPTGAASASMAARPARGAADLHHLEHLQRGHPLLRAEHGAVHDQLPGGRPGRGAGRAPRGGLPGGRRGSRNRSSGASAG